MKNRPRVRVDSFDRMSQTNLEGMAFKAYVGALEAWFVGFERELRACLVETENDLTEAIKRKDQKWVDKNETASLIYREVLGE